MKSISVKISQVVLWGYSALAIVGSMFDVLMYGQFKIFPHLFGVLLGVVIIYGLVKKKPLLFLSIPVMAAIHFYSSHEQWQGYYVRMFVPYIIPVVASLVLIFHDRVQLNRNNNLINN